MGNRSNINLVGNTTQGQNLGTGEGIYVGKSVGNILQYKSLSVTGTTMAITCDDNNIYFSANTGGGGGSGFTISNNGLCDNGTTTVGLGGTLVNDTTISGGESFAFSATCMSNICLGSVGTISLNDSAGSANKAVMYGCGSSCVDVGPSHVVLNSNSDGDIIHCVQSSNRCHIFKNGDVYMPDLATCTSETNVLYVDAAGKISSGATGGGASAISGYTCAANSAVSIGYGSLPYVVGSIYNIAIGSCVMTGITTGDNNVGIGSRALCSVTEGYGNIGVGSTALLNTSTGYNNVAIGQSALLSNTDGFDNFAVGFESQKCSTSSFANISIGCWSLCCNTSGYDNVALGHQVLLKNSTGAKNFVVGRWAACGNTTGSDNFLVGYRAGVDSNAYYNIGIGPYVLCKAVNPGNYNIALGYNSMCNSTTGSDNIALGRSSLDANTTGSNNVVVGLNAGGSLTTGSRNVFLGCGAGFSETTLNDKLHIANCSLCSLIEGDFTGKTVTVDGSMTITDLPSNVSGTCIVWVDVDGNLATAPSEGYSCLVNCATSYGCSSLPYETTGCRNTAYGAIVLSSLSGGCYNTGVGTFNLCKNTTGHRNIAIGDCVLAANTTGCDNIALGQFSLSNMLTGIYNTGIGTYSLFCSTEDDYNIAIGYQAGYSIESSVPGNADCNIAMGPFAMRNKIIGDSNIAFGERSQYSAASGKDNISIGQWSLYTSNGGDRNIGIGAHALRGAGASAIYDNIGIGSYAVCTTTGNYNIGIGDNALKNGTTDTYNVAIGSKAMCGVSSGSYNTVIGAYAGYNNGVGSRNVLIGNCAGYNGTGNDRLIIANCSLCSLVIGDFSGQTICNGGNNTAWDTSSDCRIKECVEPISGATLTLSQLNPVLFDYTTGFSETRGWDECRRVDDYGFLAQEFETVFPQYVSCSEGLISSGTTVQDFRTINTGHLIPVLVKAIQELEARVQQLESQ